MMKTPDGKDMNVPSKTPEEIKIANKLCAEPDGKCNDCPYSKAGTALCVARKSCDTIAYIEQLERERDAAIEALRNAECLIARALNGDA